MSGSKESLLVVQGAQLECDLGDAKAALQVTISQAELGEELKVACVLDHAPVTNVPPFGTCSIDNKPCVPVTTTAWHSPLSVDRDAAELALVVEDSVLKCAKGGVIGVADPGQRSVVVHVPADAKARWTKAILGQDKGLMDPQRQAELCQKLHALEERWGSLDAGQRRAEMEALINESLRDACVPEVTLNAREQMSPGTKGSYWDGVIHLPASAFESDTLPEGLGETLYHEGRHAEQAYLMLRALAADGLTAEQIQDDYGFLMMPPSIIEQAVLDPLDPASPEYDLAVAFYASNFGAQRAESQRLKQALQRAIHERDLAAEALRGSMDRAKEWLALLPSAEPDLQPTIRETLKGLGVEISERGDTLRATEAAMKEARAQTYSRLAEEADASVAAAGLPCAKADPGAHAH